MGIQAMSCDAEVARLRVEVATLRDALAASEARLLTRSKASAPAVIKSWDGDSSATSMPRRMQANPYGDFAKRFSFGGLRRFGRRIGKGNGGGGGGGGAEHSKYGEQGAVTY